jgi:hypothetical protein
MKLLAERGHGDRKLNAVSVTNTRRGVDPATPNDPDAVKMPDISLDCGEQLYIKIPKFDRVSFERCTRPIQRNDCAISATARGRTIA